MNKYKIILLTELYCLWEGIWSWIPGRTGRLIRKLTIAPFITYKKPTLLAIWQVEIPEYVHLWKPWNIECNGYLRFGRYSQINAETNIYFGQDVMIGPFVMFSTVNHSFIGKDPIRSKCSNSESIRVGSDVWIGGHVCILSGSVIPMGSVIAAGSVYTKSSSANEDYSIYAGTPSKPFKSRL